MIQVIFSFHKGNPRGGQGNWVQEILLFDDDIKADELTTKINEYKSDSHSGYHTNITVKSITRI